LIIEPRIYSRLFLLSKINVLSKDESGAIFIGTRDGLYKLKSQRRIEAVNFNSGNLRPSLNHLEHLTTDIVYSSEVAFL